MDAAQIIQDQYSFFDVAFFNEKGYLKNLNDNFFIPFHGEDDQDYLAYKLGGGKELESNMRAPHSSSALCVNFFKYWQEKASNDFCYYLFQILWGMEVGLLYHCEFEFEKENFFGKNKSRQTGRPGWVDLQIRGNDKYLIQIESKFIESAQYQDRYSFKNPNPRYIENTRKYERLFESYFLCNPKELMDGGELSNFYQLAQRLLFVVENADSMINGYANRTILLLYYDHRDFDRSLLRFSDLIKEPLRKHFRHLSYQNLFQSMKDSDLFNEHQEWFHYMEGRYFMPKMNKN